ncbi:AI-2E family transporter [Dyella jejuensis]|uniref:AI-2E family transporter n=1 Tax=Dyella jejuensis TaxID=1432009 RepID=A0ABW8JK21_9GAMM
MTTAKAPEGRQVMPLPKNLSTVFLGGLFFFAAMACMYVAKDVLLPIMLAFFLKLLVQPGMRLMKHLRLPRVVASLLALASLMGCLIGLADMLSTPAGHWARRLPEGLPRLQQRVRIVSEPIDTMARLFLHAKSIVVGGKAPAPPAPATSVDFQQLLLSTVHHFASGFVWTFLVLFFLLIAGDTFLRRLVEVMPTFGDKRQVIDIAQQVEADISGYLVTITIMNVLVGVATGLGMWWLGLPDPLLWAVVAFCLNYVPIFGPLSGMLLFLAVGMLSLEPLWKAFMPMVVYVCVHMIEGEAVTPMLLARRFTLNPVLVIVALLFWDWMWGIPGAILAVPVLAITKIICDRVRPLAALGHFIQGERRLFGP